MLLADFDFDDQGTAGQPVDAKHYVDIWKKVDLNTERFTFDIWLTKKETAVVHTADGREITLPRTVKTWQDLDPLQAQCIIFELFEGRFTSEVTRET